MNLWVELVESRVARAYQNPYDHLLFGDPVAVRDFGLEALACVCLLPGGKHAKGCRNEHISVASLLNTAREKL